MPDNTDLAVIDFKRSSSNHTPTPKTIEHIEQYRDLVQKVAEILIVSVPHSRARSIALTHLEDAIMWGVKAHILKDKDEQDG